MRRQQQNTDELERGEQQHRRAFSIHQMCLRMFCGSRITERSALKVQCPQNGRAMSLQSVSQSVSCFWKIQAKNSTTPLR